MKEGKFIFTFDPTKVAKFGVLPRYAKDELQIKWFELPNCFIFHNGLPLSLSLSLYVVLSSMNRTLLLFSLQCLVLFLIIFSLRYGFIFSAKYNVILSSNWRLFSIGLSFSW